MENFNNHTKLRFLNCVGFGLQQGDSLLKITDFVFEINAESSIIYLLTDKGNIKCTLLAQRRDYESPENIDRRTSNVANNFNILWDDNGEICTIFYHPKEDGCGCSVVASILCLMVGCLIGWAITYFFICDKSEESKDVVDTIENVGGTETDTASSVQELSIADNQKSENPQYSSNSVESSNEKIRYNSNVDYLEDAEKYRDKLWSLSCNLRIVQDIKGWYQGLDFESKKKVNGYYNFERAIRSYLDFFHANSVHDILRIKASKRIFSPDQYKVIFYGYGQSPEQFSRWKKMMGMSFDKPYAYGLID